MKRTISVKYYECPVCGRNSTNRQEIEKHYKKHQIKVDEVIYCKICGAGWYANAYGKEEAQKKAQECYKKHVEAGNIDEVAATAFFLSKGVFGYTRITGK